MPLCNVVYKNSPNFRVSGGEVKSSSLHHSLFLLPLILYPAANRSIIRDLCSSDPTVSTKDGLETHREMANVEIAHGVYTSRPRYSITLGLKFIAVSSLVICHSCSLFH